MMSFFEALLETDWLLLATAVLMGLALVGYRRHLWLIPRLLIDLQRVAYAAYAVVRRHWDKVAAAGLFVFLLFAISAGLILLVNENGSEFWKSVVAAPGSAFIVPIGFFTFVGIILTITTVHEVSSRINRYEEFLVRAAELLEEAHESEEKVRILCVTPLHGNLTERGTYYYNNYAEMLTRLRNDGQLYILHSSEKRIISFYERFGGSFDASDIRKAREDSIEWVDNAEEENETRVLEANVGYRILLSADRAIFYVPLHLPLQVENLGRLEPSRRMEVEMIGFETHNRLMVAELRRDFEFHWGSDESAKVG